VTRPGRAALGVVLVTVALDRLALGIVVPVLPGLVCDFLGTGAAQAVEVYGVFGTVLGALSDRFGRRPLILLSNFGLGVDYLVMALAPSLRWLFVGRALSGVGAASGGMVAAYLADVTPPQDRARAFGALGAASALGLVFGPALGGVLGDVSLRAPFWVAAGLSLANGLYALVALPESLPRERRSAIDWRRANPLGALGQLGRHARLAPFASVMFLATLASLVLPSTFALYAMHRFAWTSGEIGVALTVVGVSLMVVQALLIRPVVAWLGERGAALLGLGFAVIGFAGHGLARTSLQLWCAVPLTALSALATAPLQSMISQRVDPGAQGRVQGALGSLSGLADLIGPGLFTYAFARSIALRGLPGTAFLLAAALMTVAMAITAWATRGES